VRENAIQTQGLRVLETNQKVSFEIDSESDIRGPQATKVCIIN
ncbi:MAG: cold-shock protein, partial [Actinobacteria bacterium]|nr:cold-shock protein [Actinomycetota bacterium]